MATYGYCRVSTTRQSDQGISLEEQQRRLQGRALEEGWTLARIFVECGVSGSIPLAKRPQGGELWTALRPGDVVIAPKLDRMFRSARDALQVIESFRKRKIRLYLLDLGGEVTEDGVARMLLTILAAVAEFERERIAERVRDAKAHRRAQGKATTGVRSFGYNVDEDGTLRPDPYEQEVIAYMRARRELGVSCAAITRELREQGVKITIGPIRRILEHDPVRDGTKPTATEERRLRKARLLEEALPEMRRLYEQGLSLRKIAERLHADGVRLSSSAQPGARAQAVKSMLVAAGVHRPLQWQRPRRNAKGLGVKIDWAGRRTEIEAAMRRLYVDEQLGHDEIASAIEQTWGVILSGGLVRRMLIAAGIPSRPQAWRLAPIPNGAEQRSKHSLLTPVPLSNPNLVPLPQRRRPNSVGGRHPLSVTASPQWLQPERNGGLANSST
jgi:DNA invertase Pin-like site-specific DNA recombinase